MEIKHFYGPYSQGQSEEVTLSNVYKILQIGIERPHSLPIAYYTATDTYPGDVVRPTLSIDGVSYSIMDNDIIEFNGLYQSKIKVTFLKNVDEYTIITLAFMDVDA